MKFPIHLALLALLTSCSALPSAAGDNLNTASKSNRASFYFGGRKLDHGDWSPVDDQTAFGADFSRVTGAIGWEVGVQGSRESDDVSGAKLRGTTREIHGGLRVEAGDNVIRPYAGAGLAYINAKIDPDVGASDDDGSLAGYLHGGVTCDLGTAFYVGLDARVLFGSDLTINGASTDADYGQLAIVVGFAF